MRKSNSSETTSSRTGRMITILAPMDDVTDTVFRRIVSDCASPTYTVTEFVNVDGLCSAGRERVIHKLSTECDTTPVIAQIWGKKPENFRQTAYEIAHGLLGNSEYESWLKESSRKAQRDEMHDDSEAHSEPYKKYGDASTGAGNTAGRSQAGSMASYARQQAKPVRFSGVDINFGCPDKAVVKNECCSAMQQPHLREKAGELIQATLDGLDGRLPLTLKTRLGFKEIDYTWHEFLLGYKPAMLTVHVRTTKQMSKVPAQWEAIEPILKLRDKISPETKIILNGDIETYSHGEKLVKKYRVDGVMIGRGIFKNPYAFAEDAEEKWQSLSREERVELFNKHLNLFDATYQNNERKFNPLKKFAKVYISDFEGASELRNDIMQCNSVEEVQKLL